MKKSFKIVLFSFFALALTLVSAPVTKAVTGEGTATFFGGGVSQTVNISSSNSFVVVLTVGASGIATDAANPTFTLPAGFTAPAATPVANAGLVDADGKWSAVASGGTCAVTMGSSSATGQVMTVDVTGACVSTNTITLTYMGSAPATAMPATAFTVKTADTAGHGAVVAVASSPTIVVQGTAVFANHATAGVATTNNLIGLAKIGGTDKVLGGFKITATGENINITGARVNIALGTMVIGELSNLRIIPDDGTGAGVANDGIMQAGELAAPLATLASPIVGNNAFTISSTITAGTSKNYFIVGTIASTVSDSDTITVQATGAGSTSTGVTSLVAITPTGTSSNSAMTLTDTTPPTLNVSLSNDSISGSQTAVVTFTFSEAPTGFSLNNVSASSGTLGVIDASNPLIETAVFTPSTNTYQLGNNIIVDTNWTDTSVALNHPVDMATSESYIVDTRASTATGGRMGGGSGSSYIAPMPVVTFVAPVTSSDGKCPNGNTYESNCTVLAVANNVSYLTFSKAITAKSAKTEIKNLQKALNIGLGDKLSIKLKEDGKWGTKTTTALNQFQEVNNIQKVNGVGPLTRKVLNDLKIAQ